MLLYIININRYYYLLINDHFNLSIFKNLIKLFYLHCSCKKEAEKSNKKNLKVIKNNLPNKSGKPQKIIRAVVKLFD